MIVMTVLVVTVTKTREYMIGKLLKDYVIPFG